MKTARTGEREPTETDDDKQPKPKETEGRQAAETQGDRDEGQGDRGQQAAETPRRPRTRSRRRARDSSRRRSKTTTRRRRKKKEDRRQEAAENPRRPTTRSSRNPRKPATRSSRNRRETDDKKQPKLKETRDEKQPKPKETGDKKQPKPKETGDDKQPKPKETGDNKQPKPNETGDQKQDDVTWSNLHEKAVCDGEISSEPFVKGDEVYVSFESGLEWRVPHLVPDDLKGEQKALPMVGQTKQKPKPKASPKPVPDFDLGCCRIKYASQGQKMPILKFEVRADRTGPCSIFKQKMQVVLKPGGFTAEQGMNFLKTVAFAYDGMNLCPDAVDFKVCKQSLLDYGSKNGVDWSKHLSWQFVNRLKLPGFPEASIGLI